MIAAYRVTAEEMGTVILWKRVIVKALERRLHDN